LTNYENFWENTFIERQIGEFADQWNKSSHSFSSAVGMKSRGDVFRWQFWMSWGVSHTVTVIE